MAEAIVEHDYSAKQPDELTIKKGDVIKEVVKKQEGWCEGVLDGKRGLFPDNFVMLMQVKMRSNSTNTRKCRVIYSYKQEHEDELSLTLGDVIDVVGEEEEGWWRGKMNGRVGVFPSNFVEEINLNNSNLEAEKKEANGKEEVIPEVAAEVPKSVKICCEVKYAYQAQNSDELSLKEGDILTLISKDGQDAGWWRGELDGNVGVFPDNFVIIIDDLKQPPALKTQYIASQRKSQEIKPLKIETTAPPIVPNKKPSVPFKKSPSGTASGLFSSITKKIADTIDGAAGSKSIKLSNDDSTLNKDGGISAESYHAFDNIERNPVLLDPRATRVKGPGRRPLSVALKDQEGLVINGNSDYGSLEDTALAEDDQTKEIKPRSIDVQKPPWLDEMNKKMINKNKSSDVSLSPVPPVDMSRSMPAVTQKPKPEVKPPSPKTPPSEVERVVMADKVILRSKPLVNIRPQTIEAPGRPLKTSPTINRNLSPTPPLIPPVSPSGKPPIADRDRSSVDLINSRHFNELTERMANLEMEVRREREEFLSMIDDLRGRLQVETDMRMQLQVELEKLQAHALT